MAKRTLPVLDAYALGSLRYAIGALLFVVLLGAVEGRRALRYEGKLVPAAVTGVIGITGFNLFVWLGLGYTEPEHAAILLQLQSPLTALAVWWTRGQRPAGFTLGCIAVALAGVFLVVTRGRPGSAFEGGALRGDLLVLLGALSWIAYTLSAGRFPGWSPLRFTVLTCVPGTLGLLGANAVALALGAASLPAPDEIAALGWQIVYFATCTVVLGVLGFNASVRHLGPLNTMLMLNLVPVGVFVIEAALGREFAVIELAGAATVIGALAANNLYLRGASTRR